MVKGEVDIVEDWVLYHGTICGFENLFIIDNLSRDGTYQKLLELKKKYNIHVTRATDYKRKGVYMTAMLRKFGNGEKVFPIDIDEFIVYYNKNNTISCDKDVIINYTKSLPQLPYYKMNYIQVKTFNPKGYERATIECTNGKYDDRKGFAKTFFHSGLFKGVIDHGNHYSVSNYLMTNLCLVHFHQRNLDQIKKKVFNNVNGLGHNPFDLNYLLYLKQRGHAVIGFHHIDKQIKILTNTFKLDVEKAETNDICLEPLNNTLIELKK